jgi:hypothetical protein
VPSCARSPKARNEAFTDSVNRDIDKVHITPVRSSLWKSPVSGKCYHTRYPVALDGARPSQRAHLFVAATFTDQEVNAGGRHAYEGLFSVTGTLCGKKVSGQAWTEVQPTASLWRAYSGRGWGQVKALGEDARSNEIP